MIKLYADKEGTIELKEDIKFDESFPDEIKEQKFYIIAENDIRDLSIEVKDDSYQISVTQPPKEIKRGEVWEGNFIWKAGLIPPKERPEIIIRGTEIVPWG